MAEREGEMCEGNRGEWVMIHTVVRRQELQMGRSVGWRVKKCREMIEEGVKC
jgi:hypothetical protein